MKNLIKKYYFNHPFIIAAIAIGILLVGSILMEFFVDHARWIIFFDKTIYISLNSLPHNKLIDSLLYPFDLWFLPWKIFFFPGFFYSIFLITFTLILRRNRTALKPFLVSLIIGYIIAGMLLYTDSHFAYRQRPFLHLPNQHLSNGFKQVLVKAPSFPSGHTRDTTIVATITSYFLPEIQIAAIVFSVFIAVSRVYTGEHYPTDVLAGLLFGYFIGKIALLITISVQKHVANQKK